MSASHTIPTPEQILALQEKFKSGQLKKSGSYRSIQSLTHECSFFEDDQFEVLHFQPTGDSVLKIKDPLFLVKDKKDKPIKKYHGGQGDTTINDKFSAYFAYRLNPSDNKSVVKYFVKARDSRECGNPEGDLRICKAQGIFAINEAYSYPGYTEEFFNITLMAEIPGLTIAELLSNGFRLKTDLDVITFLLEFVNALQSLHSQGILHLDLHPGNIFLQTLENNKFKIWFCDGDNSVTVNDVTVPQNANTTGGAAWMKAADEVLGIKESKYSEKTDVKRLIRTTLLLVGLLSYNEKWANILLKLDCGDITLDAVDDSLDPQLKKMIEDLKKEFQKNAKTSGDAKDSKESKESKSSSTPSEVPWMLRSLFRIVLYRAESLNSEKTSLTNNSLKSWLSQFLQVNPEIPSMEKLVEQLKKLQQEILQQKESSSSHAQVTASLSLASSTSGSNATLSLSLASSTSGSNAGITDLDSEFKAMPPAALALTPSSSDSFSAIFAGIDKTPLTLTGQATVGTPLFKTSSSSAKTNLTASLSGGRSNNNGTNTPVALSLQSSGSSTVNTPRPNLTSTLNSSNG